MRVGHVFERDAASLLETGARRVEQVDDRTAAGVYPERLFADDGQLLDRERTRDRPVRRGDPRDVEGHTKIHAEMPDERRPSVSSRCFPGAFIDPRRWVRLPSRLHRWTTCRWSLSVLGESTPTTSSLVRCASRWSGASAVSRLLPHRLRWSKLQPPREWRNGRRAGLRIRCPKGRGSSTLPSRTTSDLRIFVLKFRAGRRGRPPCSTRRPAKSVCQRATPTASRSQMRVDNNSSLLRIRAVACTRR